MSLLLAAFGASAAEAQEPASGERHVVISSSKIEVHPKGAFIPGRSFRVSATGGQSLSVEIRLLAPSGVVSSGNWRVRPCSADPGAPCAVRSLDSSGTMSVALSDLKSWSLPQPVIVRFVVNDGFPVRYDDVEWLPFWSGASETPNPSVVEIGLTGTKAAEGLQGPSLTDDQDRIRPLVLRNAGGAAAKVWLAAPATAELTALQAMGPVRNCDKGRCVEIDVAADGETRVDLGPVWSGDLSYQVQNAANGVIRDWRTLPNAVGDAPVDTSADTPEIELSEFGATRKFRNPRSTPLLEGGSSGMVRFVNVTTDRTFILEASLTSGAAATMAVAYGFSITSSGTRSTIRTTIGAGLSFDLPLAALKGNDPVIEFKLSYAFGPEDGPVNRSVWIRHAAGERPAGATWQHSGFVGIAFRRTPDFTVMTARQYNDEVKSDQLFDSELRVTRRVNEQFEFQVLGAVDHAIGGTSSTTLKGKLTSAFGRYYLKNGGIVTIGRLPWLRPAEGLAMTLSGDVAQLTLPVAYLQSVNLGYQLVSESGNGSPDVNNRDHFRVGGEIGPFGRRHGDALRSVTLTGFVGHDRRTNDRYWSAGGVARFGSTAGRLSGSAATFWNGRNLDGVRTPAKTLPSVWMATIDWALDPDPASKKATRVFQLRAVQGRSDDPSTAAVEGDSGLTSSFVTGGFFLPSVSSHLGLPNGGAGRQTDNLTFVSLGLTDNAWSPLEWIPAIFGKLDRSAPRRIQFRYQLYRLRQLRNDVPHRGLGSEFLLSMSMTQVKVFEWTLDLASYTPPTQFDARFNRLAVRGVLRARVKF